MKRLLIPALLVAISAAFAVPEETKRDGAWLENSGPSIHLGAWHRDCQGERTLATFVVVTPTGQNLSYSRTVDMSEWFGVSFPEDFKSQFQEGPYTWRCEVSGKAVASGRFEYRLFAGGMQLRVLKP